MPDIAVFDYVHGDAKNFVEQGLIRRLPDNWKSRWKNVEVAYNNTGIGPALEEIFGGTYILPKPIFSSNKPTDPLVTHVNMVARLDWLKAIGAEIKDTYTTSEIIELARKIKEKDPGGLGDKLLPINGTYAQLSSMFVGGNSAHAMRASQFYKGEDNKYHWGPGEENVLLGLRLYQQAYREGLINPEFFNLNTSDVLQQFYTSCQTGIIRYNCQAMDFVRYNTELRKNLGINTDEDLAHTAVILGEDGKFHAQEVTNFWTSIIFSPKIEEEKFERIMDLYDYVCSDEGQLIVRLGFEGKDYTVNPDGSYNVLIPEGKTLTDIYPSHHPLYQNMMILSDDFTMVSPLYPKKYRDRSWELYQIKARYGKDTIKRIDWNVYFHDSPSSRKVNFDYEMEYAQLILMEGDIKDNWEKWKAEKAPLINPVLEELNALIK
ncbi:MAG TPA: ABC transporter substrate-binding protein [Clostridiaceae bacterium]|nr:ABC transporter substrate-binding protein [Clostridiaceae bacterium]